MKRMMFLVPLILTAAQAADHPAAPCVDTRRSYVARPLTRHDVYARQTIGRERRPARLKTSCINLESAIGIGLNAEFICVGLGDQVAATTADGQREFCRVTRVLPYSPEKGDFEH